MHPPIRKIIYQANEIRSAVERVAGDIAHWLRTEGHLSLNLLSVMEGAKPFTRDLVAALEKTIPQVGLKVQEVRVKGTEGNSLLEKREWEGSGLDRDGLSRHPLLIVDDLVDSGKTLGTLREAVLSWGAPVVKTAVLLRKFRVQSGPVDFCGFDLNLDREKMGGLGLKDYWLFGYGMDDAGRSRELDHIGWVEVR